MRSNQRLDPTTRRALLIEAAAEVFRGRDPRDVSIEEVAEAAGVSRSLVYAYFGDRGGLVAAVYLHNLEEFDAWISKALDAGLPDEVRLRRIVRRHLVFARDNEAAWTLMATAGTLQHPAVQGARRARIERIARTWNDQPSARLIAQAVVGLIEAGAQDWMDYRDCGLERATSILVSMIRSGLAGLRDQGILVTT
ncbi:MAG TPA: TetR/AcrR family transcriptional regulator [Acidimicrobiales bacterium]|nr:TetR/AcrR family transcriptional regulator [Acidimicrobiales bacterium]